MSKIIGFSGTHNTGKSTVLQHIAALNNPRIVVDTFSISRSVQADYGKPLSEIMSNPDNVLGYQTLVLMRKRSHLQNLRVMYPGDDVLILTDRTPIDINAYTRLWLNQNKITNATDWLTSYTSACKADSLVYDSILFFPPRKEIKFVAESGRASQETQRELHNLCKDFIRKQGLSVTYVKPVSLDARVAYILNHIESLS